MGTLLKAERLSGGYGKEIVIKDISFELKPGDFLGIIGPNGSGKSTLLKLLSRVLKPQAGTILFEQREMRKMGLREVSRQVAFVPQESLITFSFSCWEIVLMGRIPHLGRFQQESKRDFAVCEKVLLFTDTLGQKEKKIDELSAGERQRVIIAKALAQEPILLFLDEPTSHLDIGHQIQILDLLKRLNRQTNLTIVIVLHDLNLASEYCQRLVLLNEGRIFKDGRPEEVLTYENIEAVYKTIVIVNKNPLSAKPYVLLVPKEK